MKYLKIFALALALPALIASCGDKGDDGPRKPKVLGTAEYGVRTVHFIIGEFREGSTRWGTGDRVTLRGTANPDKPIETIADLVALEYSMSIQLPIPGAVASGYTDADISTASVSLTIDGTTYDNVTDRRAVYDRWNTSGQEAGITDGTFSVRQTGGSEPKIELSFDLTLSDGKTFTGSAVFLRSGEGGREVDFDVDKTGEVSFDGRTAGFTGAQRTTGAGKETVVFDNRFVTLDSADPLVVFTVRLDAGLLDRDAEITVDSGTEIFFACGGRAYGRLSQWGGIWGVVSIGIDPATGRPYELQPVSGGTLRWSAARGRMDFSLRLGDGKTAEGYGVMP